MIIMELARNNLRSFNYLKRFGISINISNWKVFQWNKYQWYPCNGRWILVPAKGIFSKISQSYTRICQQRMRWLRIGSNCLTVRKGCQSTNVKKFWLRVFWKIGTSGTDIYWSDMALKMKATAWLQNLRCFS